MKIFIPYFFFLLSFLNGWAQDPRTKPNILVFIADDAGWRDFGCYGNTVVNTPNIDALAKAGLRMERAFLTSPQCSPSRTSMLTGEFAHTLLTEDLHVPLSPDKMTVAHYLRGAGYHTGLIRKSHLGDAATKQFNYFHPSSDETQLPQLREFLDQSAGKPFFLWYAFIDPHRQYAPNAIPKPHDPAAVQVPPYLADTPETRSDLAQYYDEIGRMDRNIGIAVDELRRRKLLENTLIIFLSDNGKPFTRAKGTLYDEGMRTPLIFHWPATIKAGRSSAAMVSTIHLAPTLLDVAGVKVPSSMYGKSIRPLLYAQEFKGDKYVFSERNWHDCDEHIRAVRSDTFKLVRNAYIEWPHGTAADLAGSPSHQALLRLKREGKLKPEQLLVFEVPRPAIELYNVIEDPYELNNLAYDVRYRPVIQKLFKQLSDWMEETKDFPPHQRRRYDDTDRITGAAFDGSAGIPPAYED